jgi:EAL domain-containing protein (putative c-di-GMP-specific phosphodiesterase class I)
MPRDAHPDPFPPLFQPLVDIASGAVHSVRATGSYVQAAQQHGWLEEAAWRLLEGAAQAATIWREQGWLVPVSVHLCGARLKDAEMRRLQARFPRWLAARGLPAEALLFEPELAQLLAPAPVEDLLDWYRLRDSGWTLALGDFICAPAADWEIAPAVKRWAAHFQVMSAAANLPEPCDY